MTDDKESPPSGPGSDLYAPIKAKRAAINWAEVHIRGDKAPALFVDTPRRRWPVLDLPMWRRS